VVVVMVRACGGAQDFQWKFEASTISGVFEALFDLLSL
jgi:hypothetical protein